MRRLIIVTLLFVFTLAAGGLHKLAFHEMPPSQSLTALEVALDDSKAVCCGEDTKTIDVEKPRCLGDNCIHQIAGMNAPLGHGDPIRLILTHAFEGSDPGQFLRPPIRQL